MHEKALWELLYDFEQVISGGKKIKREPFPGSLDIPTIARQVNECRRCSLAEVRTKPVPGDGVLNPLVMVIGEAPGGEEDRQGLPFVGAAGQYLDKWLVSIGLDRRTNAFIGNVIKCRPPNNRDPLPQEQQACLPFLQSQISALKPKVLLCVGRISAQILLGTSEGIGRLRGQVYEFQGIPMVVTYHPSGVLRNPKYRRPVWEDLKLVKSLLDNDSYE